MRDLDWNSIKIPVFITVAIALLFAGFLFVHNSYTAPYPWLNHDVAYLGTAGARVLDGATLYRDIQEVNPPGVFYLYAFLMGISRVAALPPFLVINLFVVALGALGLWVTALASTQRENVLTCILTSMAYLIVVVRGNFSNNIIPSSPEMPCDFGQREHIFTLAFLPYVLWRVSGRRPSLLLLAYLPVVGYVASFKPYYIALVVIVELFAWLSNRKGRRLSAPLAIVSGMALPFVILLVHSPVSYRHLLHDVLPLYFSDLYSYYGLDAFGFYTSIYHVQMIMAGTLVMLLGLLHLRLRKERLATTAVLFLLTAMTYGAVLWQQKYWSYHGMVFFGVSLIAASYLLGSMLESSGRKGLRNATACICIAVMAVVALSSVNNLKVMLRDRQPIGHSIYPVIMDHERVMFFSMSVDYSYAILKSGVRAVGQWGEHYQVPVMLGIDDEQMRDKALHDYCSKLRNTIMDERPDLLLFAPYKEGLPQGTHLHDVLVRYGAVPAGKYMRVDNRLFAGNDPLLRGWIVYRMEGNGSPDREIPAEKAPV